MEYKDEDYVKMLRHIATHLPAYWVIHNDYDKGMSPREVKRYIMEDFYWPESTARACIKDLMGENCGLFLYDKKNNLLMIDQEKLEDFASNMNDLLSWAYPYRERIKELEDELQKSKFAYENLKSTLRRYIKVYGEEIMSV